MDKIKRLLLIFTLILTLIVTGCGSKNDKQEDTKSQSNDIKTEENSEEKLNETDKGEKQDNKKDKEEKDEKKSKEKSDESNTSKIEKKQSTEKVSKDSTKTEKKSSNNTSASKSESKKSSSSSNKSTSNQKKNNETQKAPNKEKSTTSKTSEKKATNNNTKKSSSSNNTTSSPKKEQVEKQEQSVTVSVSIPSGVSKGSGLSPTKVNIKDGDSILDATRKTSLDVNVSGAGSMAYVRGINGLKEFDEGPLSGWKVKVNGTYIDRSAGAYKAANNQKIEWIYTTDYTK